MRRRTRSCRKGDRRCPCRRLRQQGVGEAWLRRRKAGPSLLSGRHRGARAHRAAGLKTAATMAKRRSLACLRQAGYARDSREKQPASEGGRYRTSGALVAADKGERTRRGTVLGAIGGHGDLQKEN